MKMNLEIFLIFKSEKKDFSANQKQALAVSSELDKKLSTRK
ncbi:hypothetical protein SR187_5740 [Streptococcus ruminantium]|uniref:Uncharacterized protein n=1 Tax=Streptococcus ruminantium TaxID=1917441 RepID=A0A2Z5U3U5_9STRE|nr:hypothetical protein SR187_5740 [Streptococcus ruminantium]